MSALHTRFNIIVPVFEKLNVEGREAYKIQMPSGLVTLAWADELFLI